MLRTMWNSHVRVFMGIGAIKLFDNVLTFAQPLLLEQLLLALQEGKPAGEELLSCMQDNVVSKGMLQKGAQLHIDLQIVTALEA